MTAVVFMKYAWTLAKKNAAEKASFKNTNFGDWPRPCHPLTQE
jgi:hypothetical protein